MKWLARQACNKLVRSRFPASLSTSLLKVSCSVVGLSKGTESVATLLDEHFSLYYPIVFDPDQANRVTIRHNHIWKDAVRAMSRSSFDPSLCTHMTFVGEEAVDDGGPYREFFSLALQEKTADGTIFQGPQHSRFFMHNVQGLTSRKFFYAGMLAAVSFANGGPGLNCLSKTVYTYLCHGLKVYSRLKSHPRS